MRILARGGDDIDDAGPERGIDGKIKTQDKPSGHREHGKPVEGTQEVYDAGEVTEFALAKQWVARMDRAEPNRGQKRGQRNPDQPVLIKRGKAKCE